ncbi:alpha/beta fold hydrolase [Alphaproteobacteria bacterium KMM 3653]|uniref:Alpha/beta fold hydrolase n=1 Tax=Harenicola maris TaxID=2841044 RepID=A0AAP2CVR4_9RHOB|nr:alpha/beta fold hydrolase [Harenicola maris]
MAYQLKDFGSYTVGGRLHRVTTGTPRTVHFTRTASFEVDPRGHFAVEHAYVQYFIPEKRNGEAPMVFVHGGGMSGSCWDKTPDGRAGWLHLALDAGYEVHVVDNVERGRAGFAPGLWGGEPMLRSLEEAWVLFRIGAAEGFASRTPFENQRFPVASFDRFAQGFVPRWLGTTPLHVDALCAVLERTGPAIVVCHSQGGEITFDAQPRAGHLMEHIIALEPSGYPDEGAGLRDTTLTVCAGDYLQEDAQWQARRAAWRRLGACGPRARHIASADIGGGNSHMLMMDGNSAALFEAVLGG